MKEPGTMTAPLENDTIKRLRRQGKALQNGEGHDPRLQGNAIGALCEIMADYFEQGIVTMPHCAQNHANTLDMINETVKNSRWSWQKALAVIISTLTVCGTIAAMVMRLTPPPSM